MIKANPVVFTRGQRVALWLGVFFALWLILHRVGFANAFWTFCLTGKLPGSDVTLSPETVMRLAGLALAALVLAVVAAPVVKTLRWRKSRSRPAPARSEDIILRQAPHSLQTDSARLPFESPPQVQRYPQAALPAKVDAAVPVLQSSQRTAIIAKNMRKWTTQTSHAFLATATCTQRFLVKTSRRTKLLSVKTCRYILQTARVAWRWSSPYLWQFDHWLERQMHSALRRLGQKIRQYETLTSLLDVGKHIGKHYAKKAKRQR